MFLILDRKRIRSLMILLCFIFDGLNVENIGFALKLMASKSYFKHYDVNFFLLYIFASAFKTRRKQFDINSKTTNRKHLSSFISINVKEKRNYGHLYFTISSKKKSPKKAKGLMIIVM